VSGQDSVGDLEYLADKVAAGELRSIIDRTYGLDEIVAAHRYAESGDKMGHIVVIP
jgi:NADPH:quinone reductase-like Zn-dependent oxidoreductase